MNDIDCRDYCYAKNFTLLNKGHIIIIQKSFLRFILMLVEFIIPMRQFIILESSTHKIESKINTSSLKDVTLVIPLNRTRTRAHLGILLLRNRTVS